MTSRIVEANEFRLAFRKEAATIASFHKRTRGRPPRHILGTEAIQLTVDVGVRIITAMIGRYEGEGRTLDKDLLDLRVPKGLRRYASSQLNNMAAVSFVAGANVFETVWKSLGELIVIARRGQLNVYVAKASATAVELAAFMDLRIGKANAAMARNEPLSKAIADARNHMEPGETLEDKYTETVTEVFRPVEE